MELWDVLTYLHKLAGPAVMLLYPLYASVAAMETSSRIDDEQWLAYWILYSFITLMEMLLQPVISWIPCWYDLKLVFALWLVLPSFRGAAFIYQSYVRQPLHKYRSAAASGDTASAESKKSDGNSPSPNSKDRMNKNKFLACITPKKDHEAY